MIKEKDTIREEITKKFLNKAGNITEDDYAKKYHEVMKKNEELISKNESLMNEKEMLNKELNRADRGHNETAIKIKEITQKYDRQISSLEDDLRKSNMRLYQKEALIAKITTENEYLAQENYRLKSVHQINDSLIRLPET
jgi:predicted RNase H-like nuclease (RuvC/YqgF family)